MKIAFLIYALIVVLVIGTLAPIAFGASALVVQAMNCPEGSHWTIHSYHTYGNRSSLESGCYSLADDSTVNAPFGLALLKQAAGISLIVDFVAFVILTVFLLIVWAIFRRASAQSVRSTTAFEAV